MKKLATYLIISTYILLHIIDLITTIYVYYNHKIFNESNPFYLLIGNFWVSVIIMKALMILTVFIFFRLIKSKKEIVRYSAVVIFLLISLVIFSVVQGNIKIIQQPEISVKVSESITEYAQQTNVTEKSIKLELYKEQVQYPFYKSFFIILLIFIVFRRVEKENLNQTLDKSSNPNSSSKY